jgi:hypothetical protein
LLTLKDFGVYSLASTVAGAIFIFVNPVAQAIQQGLMTQFAMCDVTGFVKIFKLSSALLSALTGAFAAVMVTSGFQVTLIWKNSPILASQFAVLVAPITLGNLFSVYVRILSLAQYATGWTSLSVYSGMAGFFIILPLLLFSCPNMELSALPGYGFCLILFIFYLLLFGIPAYLNWARCYLAFKRHFCPCGHCAWRHLASQRFTEFFSRGSFPRGNIAGNKRFVMLRCTSNDK